VSSVPAPRPYHHGDLKRALVETAADLLREASGAPLTLREVARRAGVSHAAPYKHFADKAALLDELCSLGFEQLDEVMAAAVVPQPSSVQQEWLALARAYIAFGADNPALYRLMLGPVQAPAGDVAPAAAPARGAMVRARLHEVLQRGQQAGLFRRRPQAERAMACWALLHGLTLMHIDGLQPQDPEGTPLQAAALAAWLEGLEC
jgi:AcrR family transcriptional regulator